MRRFWALVVRFLLVIAASILLLDAVVIGIIYWEYGLLFLAGMMWQLTRKRWQSSGSHGTARMADLTDLMRGGLLSDRGLILARVGGMPAVSRGQALRSLLSPGLSSERVTFPTNRGRSEGLV